MPFFHRLMDAVRTVDPSHIIRVGAVAAHEMAPGVGDLHEGPGHEFNRIDPLRLGQLGLVVSSLGDVDDLVGAGGEVQAGPAHRRSQGTVPEGVPAQREDELTRPCLPVPAP